MQLLNFILSREPLIYSTMAKLEQRLTIYTSMALCLLELVHACGTKEASKQH